MLAARHDDDDDDVNSSGLFLLYAGVYTKGASLLSLVGFQVLLRVFFLLIRITSLLRVTLHHGGYPTTLTNKGFAFSEKYHDIWFGLSGKPFYFSLYLFPFSKTVKFDNVNYQNISIKD